MIFWVELSCCWGAKLVESKHAPARMTGYLEYCMEVGGLGEYFRSLGWMSVYHI